MVHSYRLAATSLAFGALIALAWIGPAAPSALADETCQSPYLPKLEGQEDFVYVWTLGASRA